MRRYVWIGGIRGCRDKGYLSGRIGAVRSLGGEGRAGAW